MADERVKFSDRILQRKFLITFQHEMQLSNSEFARFLGVPRSTLHGWINEAETLPRCIFDKICKNLPKLEYFKDKIRILPPNWAQVRGGISRVTGENIHEMMRVAREAKEKVRLERKMKTEINNSTVKELIRNGVDLKRVLAVCLLTDGSLHKISDNSYRISFFSTDEELKNIAFALLHETSRYLPTIYLDLDGVYSIRTCDLYLAKELLKLSPSYKKSPSWYQSVDEYLKEKQPTVSFLNNCDSKTQIACIRFAFSADGSISLSKQGRVELTLSCAHPQLCFEWRTLLEKFSLKGKIREDANSWSGVYGLRFYNRKYIENFLTMGGFIPRIKITRNSKYCAGMEKNKLLRFAVGCKHGPVFAR
jgi:DNA-binding transcriptional regulator WhiA